MDTPSLSHNLKLVKEPTNPIETPEKPDPIKQLYTSLGIAAGVIATEWHALDRATQESLAGDMQAFGLALKRLQQAILTEAAERDLLQWTR